MIKEYLEKRNLALREMWLDLREMTQESISEAIGLIPIETLNDITQYAKYQFSFTTLNDFIRCTPHSNDKALDYSDFLKDAAKYKNITDVLSLTAKNYIKILNSSDLFLDSYADGLKNHAFGTAFAYEFLGIINSELNYDEKKLLLTYAYATKQEMVKNIKEVLTKEEVFKNVNLGNQRLTDKRLINDISDLTAELKPFRSKEKDTYGR
jgi:hypothetical protein